MEAETRRRADDREKDSTAVTKGGARGIEKEGEIMVRTAKLYSELGRRACSNAIKRRGHRCTSLEYG